MPGCCGIELEMEDPHVDDAEPMESHLGRMEAQLTAWGTHLDALQTANEAGAAAKVERRQRIDDIKAKHQHVVAEIDALRAHRGEKWSAFRLGIEGAWRDLEAGFKHLTG